MKKLLPFLIAFISSLSINAQSPSLSFTNVTGSNSITCNVSSINYIASVSNYTAGPLTYTWVSLSGTASGTNVTLNNPSTYTLTAFNIANSFSLSQVFTIGFNQVMPSSISSPMIQNITCNLNSLTTVTATGSPTTNITHKIISPSGGTLTVVAPVALYSPFGPGTYTHVTINNINGCASSSIFTVTSSSGFPVYNVSSPTQFTIGCGTTSVSAINITNVTTTPIPGGPVSYTVLPPSFVGPTYNTGLSTTYTAAIPGTYTVIVKDNTNACETKVQLSVLQNTAAPVINISMPTQTLSCNTPSVILTGATTGSNAAFSWAFPGPGSPIISNTIVVSSISLTTNTVTSTYTLTIMNLANMCTGNQSLTIYQNLNPPTASINPPNPSISCTTPSVLLTSSSVTNIPPVFFAPLPVVGFAWYGPVPQASLANISSYLAYTPGTYTFIAKDLNNGCTTTGIKTVIDNRIYPFPISSVPFNINCPIPTATIFPTITGPTAGFTYSWTAPATASVSSLTQATITVNMPGNYTITVTNPINSCASTSLITVSVCASIEQNSGLNNNINIFPNPNNGVFTLDLAEIQPNSVIEIYSAFGVLIKKQAIISEKSTLNLQNEVNGLYFIYVISGEKAIKVSKIVKN